MVWAGPAGIGLVLHQYDFLADIPITDMSIISKADNYNRSDIILKSLIVHT